MSIVNANRWIQHNALFYRLARGMQTRSQTIIVFKERSTRPRVCRWSRLVCVYLPPLIATQNMGTTHNLRRHSVPYQQTLYNTNRDTQTANKPVVPVVRPELNWTMSAFAWDGCGWLFQQQSNAVLLLLLLPMLIEQLHYMVICVYIYISIMYMYLYGCDWVLFVFGNREKCPAASKHSLYIRHATHAHTALSGAPPSASTPRAAWGSKRDGGARLEASYVFETSAGVAIIELANAANVQSLSVFRIARFVRRRGRGSRYFWDFWLCVLCVCIRVVFGVRVSNAVSPHINQAHYSRHNTKGAVLSCAVCVFCGAFARVLWSREECCVLSGCERFIFICCVVFRADLGSLLDFCARQPIGLCGACIAEDFPWNSPRDSTTQRFSA